MAIPATVSIDGPNVPSCSESGTVSSSVTTTTVPVNIRSHNALVAPSSCAVVTVCLFSRRVSPEEAEPVNWSLPTKVAITGGEVLDYCAAPACRSVAPVVAVDDELLTNIARLDV